MKTKPSLFVSAGMIAFFTPAVLMISPEAAASDIPDQPAQRLAGMYKIVSSNDPIFPMNAKQEWFLDFGSGNKLSGSVAVSLRQNPNVRVRIMAWQYFPEQNTFFLGNPYEEGSQKAVAKGTWTMGAGARGVTLARGSYQVVMSRAAASDY